MKVRCSSTVLTVLLLGRQAPAEESRSFRLDYSAPVDCPGEAAFASAIQSSSARARRAVSGEKAIEINASIAAENGGFRGALRIRWPDGTETRRAVPAATCDEAASGMALIAAIEIDPDAAPVPVVAAAVASSPPAATPPTASSVPAPPAAGAPPAASTPASPRESSASVPAKTVPPPRSSRRSFWIGAGASIGVATALAPDFSPDFGIAVGAGSERKALFSPVAFLSAHLAESPDISRKEGTAQFQRLSVRVTGCPLAASVGWLVLRPCALFEAGQLRVRGSGAMPSLTAKSLWVELGATLRGEMRLDGPLMLGAEVGAVFPLVTDSFFFQPTGATVHEIPPIGFTGALEIGVRFL